MRNLFQPLLRIRRSVLWALLVALVLSLLVTLVWLAGRYESSEIENRLERDAAEAVLDIRTGLTRNIQSFQAMQSGGPRGEAWMLGTSALLREHREIMRLEWRSDTLAILSLVNTPYRTAVFERFGRASAQADVASACASARRVSGAAYSSSYFVPQTDGLGMEVMDVCLPIVTAGQLTGYTVATYALQDVMAEMVSKQLARGQSLSFTEADGTRLALYGPSTRGSRVFVARQLLDLPGNTLVLRLESRLGLPGLFPNVLTALLTAMSLALMAVLFLLARDMRRRLKVENDLGEALAFRKAMEDSVLTGLRARDLSGRITYVNPAFCQMVGIPAKDLLYRSFPSPYWPPELADVYQQRQTIRLAGNNLPREGHESVFIRPDGTRFPVLIMEAPLINAVGKHTGWMSAILDVSEQRRVEELSRASQDRLQATARLAMVGEMASLLSHELNQPLAAISSYAVGSLNLLNDAPQAPHTPLAADLELAMKRIAEQAERAGKVIKSVHDFVRRRDQAREAVTPAELMQAVMPLVSLQARKLQVTVVTDIDAHCSAVLCDRTMVEQVLLNLARNGMQAMQNLQGTAHRVLTLQVRPAAAKGANRWVEFAVIDQGDGIAPEVASQLFTPFFTTKVEGMGLGLSLCRTVIEQHGGFLGFEAVQPRGTAFRFTLPVDGPHLSP
jgi:two-component system sensor histidine kinase DctS